MLGYTNDERNARASSPRGVFLPMLLFAKVPTVVRPQYNNRVFRVWAVFKRVQYATEHRIGKMNGRKITLYPLFPLALLLDVSEVSIGTSALSCRWKIIQIVFAVTRWKLD